ncbi:MAG: hypothetical protein NNA20_10545 [Nitrospira sp.]|nr:hypothetical protein [Nitrospira sp.]MCP9443025.1 hypothetical protein [Nitrospira sp.]
MRTVHGSSSVARRPFFTYVVNLGSATLLKSVDNVVMMVVQGIKRYVLCADRSRYREAGGLAFGQRHVFSPRRISHRLALHGMNHRAPFNYMWNRIRHLHAEDVRFVLLFV